MDTRPRPDVAQPRISSMRPWLIHERMPLPMKQSFACFSYPSSGVKTQYQGTQGRVQLYVGNKSPSPLSDFAVSVSWSKGISGMLTLGTGAPIPPTSGKSIALTRRSPQPALL